MSKEKPEAVLKKDRNCMHCEKLFDCKGKPQEVKRCLQYKERVKL